MSTASTTPPPLHSFPSEWTAPASCFASTNYYRVVYRDDAGKLSRANLYGTPMPVFASNTPSGACFPPSFTVNAPYLTDGSACPAGYTRACATAGASAAVSTITCCPSVTGDAFSFMCRDNEYGCHGTAAAGGITWTGTITDLGATLARESPVTRTPWSTEGVEAWGIKLLSVAPGATATGTPAPSPDNQGTTASAGAAIASQGPSGGAVAGIVVGSIAGAALLAVGAFLLYRRNKSSPGGGEREVSMPSTSSYQRANDGPSEVASGQGGSTYQPSEMEGVSPYQTSTQPRQTQQEPVELV